MDSYAGREEFITADVIEAGIPVEAYSIEDQKHNLILAGESIIEKTKDTIEESTAWLPFFSELYNISANIKDYILVPVAIMPSDLPNRNAQAFPLEELTRADPEMGLLGYQTWARKPTHIDHINKDYTKAKGIILSSTMNRIPNTVGKLWKVNCLCSYDRSRDPILANNILTGKRPSYSMGAWSRHFSCSICGSIHNSKIQGCDHVNVKFPKIKLMPDDKLAYLQARYITGFEVSSVSKPAFSCAVTPPEHHLK